MRLRSRSGLLALGSAVATMTVVGVSFAALGTDVPRGPYIDFCPTTEQIEAHLKEYGFDYKPTVPCGEAGEEITGPGEPAGAEVSASVVFAREKERLLKAKRGPDVDGDPRTIEIIYADGTESTIIIQAENPKYWDGLTLAQVAEKLYP